MKLFRKTTLTATICLALPAAILYAQETATAAAADTTSAPEELTIDWIQEIINGGITSAVLLLLSAAAIGFLAERLIRMRGKFFAPGYYSEFFKKSIQDGNTQAIIDEATKNPSILAEAGAFIATHRDMDIMRLQTAVGDQASRVSERHRQRCYPLAIIATMAPMLGLLGTVIGMIEAFSKVAVLGDTGDAAVLADSISKALITTDIGLVLAIPSLGAYHFLKEKLAIMELSVEETLEDIFAFLEQQDKQ